MRRSLMLLGVFGILQACQPASKSDDVVDTQDSDTDTDTDTDTEVEDTGDLIDSGDVASLTGVPPDSVVALPEFAAINRDGSARGPNDLLDKRTIMWFFPFANTPG